jgi:HAD superfamily hydrolase (TIGR01509 family)
VTAIPPLRGLLVDVGGTLVDDATWVERERYAALMIERLEEAFGTRHHWFEPLTLVDFPESDAPDWEQGTVAAVTAFLAEHGFAATPEQVERVCRACAVPMSRVVQLADGAREAVEAARELGLRLVICSNTLWRSDEDIRRDWEELGFAGLFDGYVSSHSTGFGKPHPAIFDRCLRMAGVGPDEAAIIGDNPSRDMVGARAVGMRSIWIRPPEHVGDPHPAPDATVERWAEVPSILRRWVGVEGDQDSASGSSVKST